MKPFSVRNWSRGINCFLVIALLAQAIPVTAAPVSAPLPEPIAAAPLLPVVLMTPAPALSPLEPEPGSPAAAAPPFESQPGEPVVEAAESPAPLISPLPVPQPPDLNGGSRPAPAAMTATLAAQGGRLAVADGRVAIDFPAQALTRSVALRLRTARPADQGLESPVGGPYWWLVFGVEPATAQGATLLSADGHLRLAKPVTVTIDLRGFPSWQIPYLVHLDGDVVPSRYDAEAGTLTAVVDRFSDYGVAGTGKIPDDGAHFLLTSLPDTSLFNGSVNYSYKLDVPAGRNGLQPGLSLEYSSSGLNGMMGAIQSGDVGLSWSIGGQTEIVRPIQTHSEWSDQTGRSETMWSFENNFSLVLNGASYPLRPQTPLTQMAGGGCRYYAQNAPGLLVVRYNERCGFGGMAQSAIPNETDEYWMVTTADGTKYRLGFNSDAEQTALMWGYSPIATCTLTANQDGCDDPNNWYWTEFRGFGGSATHKVAYRWSVDQVQDTSGNTMIYHYYEEGREFQGVAYDREHHLDWIRYAGTAGQPEAGRFLVQFRRELRERAPGVGHDDGPVRPDLWEMWDTQRISSVRICDQNCDSVNNILWEYDLEYQCVTEVHPSWMMSSDEQLETTRLVRIRRYGRGGIGQTNPYPATTFGYGNGGTESFDQTTDELDHGEHLRYPRLLRMENGYSGTVTIEYNNSATANPPAYVYNYIYSYVAVRKSVSDGLGHTGVVTYSYERPCFNYYSNQSLSCHNDETGGTPTPVLVGHEKVRVWTYDYDGRELSVQAHAYITAGGAIQGRETATTLYAPGGTEPLQRQYPVWVTRTVEGNLLPLAYLDESVTEQYLGGVRIRRQRTDYDGIDAYGNTLREYRYGDDTVSGDERTAYHHYISVTTALTAGQFTGKWFPSLPAKEVLYEGIVLVTQTATAVQVGRTYYDGQYDFTDMARTGHITRGLVSMVWQGGPWGTPLSVTTQYAYDGWGNRISETDAEGRVTQTGYDATDHQYPVAVTNTLGQHAYTEYYGVNATEVPAGASGLPGQVWRTWVETATEAATQYSYDVMGRLQKTALPGDSLENPTER